MNRPLKRLLGLAGSVVLGTFGAVALVSPAQAHHNTITAGSVCADGKIRINWKIENSEDDKAERITAITKTPNTDIKKASDNSLVGVGTQIEADETLEAYQIVSANTTTAKLAITAKWAKTGHVNYDEKTYTIPALDCDPGYTGQVTGGAECDNETGEWKVRWQVTNQHPERKATVQVISAPNTDAERTATQTGGVWTTLANENAVNGVKDNDQITGGNTETARQRVAGSAQAARLKISFSWTNSSQVTKEYSTSATVNFIGQCVKNLPKPDAVFASDCSGEVTVTLYNMAGATKDAKFIVYGAGGWASEEKTLAAGESTIVSVPKTNSSSVVVKESGEVVKTYSWQDSTNCHPLQKKVSHTCEGVTIELINPAKGAAHTYKLDPTSGETVSGTLQPGADVTHKFAAPNDEDEFKIEVSLDGQVDRTVTWERPRGCEPLDATYEETCTGLTITINNPQDGSKADIVLTPTPGEPVSFTLNPGQSKTVEFPAGPDGLQVVGTANGQGGEEPLVWTKPDDCVPPQLPKTGDNTAGYIATGAGLVALGAIVFFLARRRMVALRRMAS